MDVDVGAPDGGFAGTAVPTEAPALLWTVVIAAVALWWLWPWLARLRGDGADQTPLLGTRQSEAGGMRLPHAPLAAEPVSERAAVPLDEHAIAEAGAGRLTGELSFSLIPEFNETFVAAAGLIAQSLTGPPSGLAYTAALTALKKFAEVLDRLFLAFGSPDELAKVTCLRESSETFRRDYGDHDLGKAMRGLLHSAGFERRQSGEADAVWVFPHEDTLSRLRGMTVRLCLKKLAELQKARGPGRFLHTNNDAVVPKLEDAAFAELVDLYRGLRPSCLAADSPPSMRERNLQADVRLKINQRRADKGFEPLGLHDGLAAIARSLADNQRTRARKDADDLYPTRMIAVEVREALARVALPPGFAVAHLHWSSTELPRLFGMTSTRGSDESSKLGKQDTEDNDKSADIMSNEVVGFWAARQQSDVFWPATSICGIGAALDYTVNKGFVVALLVGYEKPGQEDDGLSSTSNELRRRPAAKADARPTKSSESVKCTPTTFVKPKIKGFGDIYSPPGG